MIGMHMHIGSQITSIEPYAGAVAKGVELIDRLRGMGHPIGWYKWAGDMEFLTRTMKRADRGICRE